MGGCSGPRGGAHGEPGPAQRVRPAVTCPHSYINRNADTRHVATGTGRFAIRAASKVAAHSGRSPSSWAASSAASSAFFSMSCALGVSVRDGGLQRRADHSLESLIGVSGCAPWGQRQRQQPPVMVDRELHVAIGAFHVHVDAGPLLPQIAQGLLNPLDARDVAGDEFGVGLIGCGHFASPSLSGGIVTRRRGRPGAAWSPVPALGAAALSTLTVWRRSTSPLTGSPFGMDGITTVLSGGVGVRSPPAGPAATHAAHHRAASFPSRPCRHLRARARWVHLPLHCSSEVPAHRVGADAAANAPPPGGSEVSSPAGSIPPPPPPPPPLPRPPPEVGQACVVERVIQTEVGFLHARRGALHELLGRPHDLLTHLLRNAGHRTHRATQCTRQRGGDHRRHRHDLLHRVAAHRRGTFTASEQRISCRVRQRVSRTGHRRSLDAASSSDGDPAPC